VRVQLFSELCWNFRQDRRENARSLNFMPWQCGGVKSFDNNDGSLERFWTQQCSWDTTDMSRRRLNACLSFYPSDLCLDVLHQPTWYCPTWTRRGLIPESRQQLSTSHLWLFGWLVGWSLTSLFNTNMVISETNLWLIRQSRVFKYSKKL